jgi:hypothetical protein
MPGPKGFTKQKKSGDAWWVPAWYREEKVKNIGGYFDIPLSQMAGSLLSYVKLPTNDFFSFFSYQNFGETQQKISKIYEICTGIRKFSQFLCRKIAKFLQKKKTLLPTTALKKTVQAVF